MPICYNGRLLCLFLLLLLLQNARPGTVPLIEVTTFASTYESGTLVLSTSTPTTSGGFSYQSTTLTYINSYFTTPTFGFGFAFINSNWNKTTTAAQTIIDLSVTTSSTTSQVVRANFTAGTVLQLSINYIVCLPNSYFFLDVRTNYQNLANVSSIFTASTSGSRSTTLVLPYKNKSNSSNTQTVFTTIGLSMMRQSNTFEYTLAVVSYGSTSMNVNLTVMSYNGMRFIRFAIFDYEQVVTTIDSPDYIDMGFGTGLGGTVPDSSGLNLAVTGSIFMGMTDWALSDTNAVITYNMSTSVTTYSLTSLTVTRTQTAYLWYRVVTCPMYYYQLGSLCDACHFSCATCTDPANISCLTCDSTSFRTFDGVGSCPCNGNYLDVGVLVCQKILCNNVTCLTCSSNYFCVTCQPSLSRTLSNGSCTCSTYTIDMSSVGIAACQPCFPTCYTCASLVSITGCKTCSLTRDHRSFLSTNSSCACVSGYYQIPNIATDYSSYLYNGAPCLQCQYSCQTCADTTACLSCNSALQRSFDSSTGFCVCGTGYYDSGNTQACLACSYTCYTCNSTGCLSCPTTRNLSGTSCPCNNGYYDSSVATCLPCQYTCYTCTNTSACSSCSSLSYRTMVASNLTCACNTGYYDINGQLVCGSCDLTCASCSGANNNNCLGCTSSNHRQLTTNNTCVCMTGYYQRSPIAANCSECFYTCQACTAASTCTACNASNYRTLSGSSCNCIDKYYDDGGNQLCLNCLYFCTTCTTNLICTSCDSATRNTSNLTACSCLAGYYDNGVSSSCIPCLASCATCVNSNNCLTCPVTRYLTSALACTCNPRTYEPSCNACNYSCLACSTTPTTCTLCNGTAYRYLNANSSSCVCYDTYYDDQSNQLCAPCNYSCATCSSASACLTCPTNRVINGSFCSCLSAYYQNSVNLNCLPCHYSCLTCSAYSTCTTCNSSIFRNTSTTTTLCVCSSGYYDNGISASCFACYSICESCSAFSTCTACNTTLHFYLSGTTCLCNAGYYFDSNTLACLPCDYSCATCTGPTACTTCQANRTAAANGLCTCIPTMYNNAASNNTCQACAYPCLNCVTTSSTCTSCDNTRNYTAATNSCPCNTATYDTTLACAACPSTCLTCTNSSACTACITSTLRTLSSSNQCVCPSGYNDQNGTVLTCVACNYTCATCTNTVSCTTCYSGRYPIANSICACPDNHYYDNGVSPACLSCAYSCLSCSTTSTNCTACASSLQRTLSNYSCPCNSGYYDGATAQCQTCQYSCQTCSNSSYCITCNSTNLRTYISGPYCNCMTGYFDVAGTQLCSACSYTCLTCSSGSTLCLSCPDTRNLTSSACPCNQGLYDTGTNSPTCIDCYYQCLTCSASPACLSCPQTRQMAAGMQCQCVNGYYDVVNSLLCLQCYGACQLCSAYQTCTQCDTANTQRQLVNGSCYCPNGYFDSASSGNFTCQLCHYSCQTCVSISQCSSCNLAYQRVYNLSSLLCRCAGGYFDDTSNAACIPCPSDCLTCSSATTCLTCPTTRTLNASSRCTCINSTFENGTICEQCPVECTTCNSTALCTACAGVRLLQSGACVCPTLTYAVAASASCAACNYTCATCVTGSQCSTCDASIFRYLSPTYCLCMASHYDDGTHAACQSCQYSCLTCNISNACLSCDSSKNRVYSVVTLLCQCASGYYEDANTKICIQCPYSCLTCTSATECTSCNPTFNRVLNNVTWTCDCPTAYYYDTLTSPVCASCDYTCYSCSSSATSCSSCLNTTYRGLTGSSCPCLNGYYTVVSQPVCQPCGYQCVTCTASTTCTLCSSNNFRATTPACACIDAYYDQGTATCAACNYTCQTCTNALTCTSCNATVAYRVQNTVTLLCDCMPQYFDNRVTICQPCFYACLTCDSQATCLTCPSSTRALSLSSCLCLPKFYDDTVSLNCLACNYTCQTCSGPSSCSSCNSANFRTFNSSSYLCSCKPKYYDVGFELCAACDPSCATCDANSTCLTCPLAINKTINATTGSSVCVCLYGYFQNVTAGVALGYNSICSPCYYACQTCSSASTYCTLCNTTANRYLSSAHQCLCLTNYFELYGQQECLPCYTGCVTCFGTLATNCLSCDNSTYYLNNSCYSVCPSYYVNATAPTRACVSCPTHCLSCPVSTTLCSTCATPYFIFSYNSSYSVCVDACPQYYYQISQTCYPCQWPCVTCTSASACLTCTALYYLSSNNYCYPCEKSCLTCTGSTALDCLTCIPNYILKNAVCQKLACAATQYVDSTLGCLECASSFPNSLACLSTGPTTCQTGYMLSNNSCGNCSSVTGYVYDSSTGHCKDYCGDGKIITDLCDDGNNLNGDGCSAICTIESGWRCPSNLCQLTVTPNISLVSIQSFPSNHSVCLMLQLSVGLRLVKGNFIIQFTSITNFAYQLYNTNSRYTLYLLTITYYQSIQNQQLAISIKSPISRRLAEIDQTTFYIHKIDQPLTRQNQIVGSSRELATTTSLQLNISLSLSLSIPIQTTPPAIYVTDQQSQIYSRYLLGLVAGLHVAVIVAVCIALALRLKVMLLVIDALNSLTILYILTGLALYNVTLLSYQSSLGLQPFIYPFGQTLPDTTTNFYFFDYRSNFFSSSIVQVLALVVCLVGMVAKRQTEDAQTQNAWPYYKTGFLFAFAYDLMLTSFTTFFCSHYTSYQSSYSWTLSLFSLIWIICQGVYYYKNAAETVVGRKVIPDFTYITNPQEKGEKSKKQLINIMASFDDSKSRKYSNELEREHDDPKTEEGELAIQNSASKEISINYYDLSPSNEQLESPLHSNHITPTHLPLFTVFFPIVFALLVNVQKPTIRTGLLFGATLGYLLGIIVTRNESLRAIRMRKLLALSILYVGIAATGLAGAAGSSVVNLISLDIVLVVFVCVGLLINLIGFVWNVLRSQAYSKYLQDKKTEEVLERNKRANETRQKIYTRNQTTQNIKQSTEQVSKVNIFDQEIQVSQEQVEEKEFKISALRNREKVMASRTVIDRDRDNSSIINMRIFDEISGMEEGLPAHKDLLDEKNMLKASRGSERSPGNRLRAIQGSVMSKGKKIDSPSLYLDNTLERIDEHKGARKHVGKTNEREEISPTTYKKRVKRRKIKEASDDEKPVGPDLEKAREFFEEKEESSKNIEDMLQEMDMPMGIPNELKKEHSGERPRLFSMDQISSIKQERQQFIEQGIDQQVGGVSVFNKILQDYKVYRNKKVNKKKLKQVLKQV